MAAITSAGVGSGLDLESIIQATVNAEDLPKVQRFEASKTRLSVELSGLGAVKSSLSAFQDIIKKLADLENFTKRSNTITQPASGSIISVATNDAATPGNFNIKVNQLAQGSRATTNAAFSSPTDVVSANGGKLTIAAGSKSFDVDIAAGATLEEVRAAINESATNFGVSVNIINTGGATPESKLVVTSSLTGLGNDLSITSDTAELDSLSTTAFGGGAGGLTIAAADVSKDAIIEVDGITINSSSNIFKDAVQDLTITATKVSEGTETARLTVDYDKTGVEKLLGEFIDSYNNAIGTIDYHTKVGAALYGDSAIRSLRSQMTNSLSTVVSGAGGFETLFDVGIGLTKDGKLEKSSLVRSVTEALTSDYSNVGKLFSGDNGVAKSFETFLETHLESKGSFKFREDNLNKSLKQIENDRESHDYRMSQLESGLRAKYASLDVLIAQMQSTGSYITQQLASLPGFTSKK
ncbi:MULTISPECIES: flagellar filament capping protein FliD [unclassified Arsukibacterium]|uniref:flagellar filament capping protein FliD n=1 Tax=unclassified Arsukibacterium TaxID=2635278 RepID=UPI000C8EC897|nr:MULTISPECIES: flagellar filament capping protein FliD [unclassified Arsukibacterium]MAA96322.1 flagellar cap protein [Rheinheimera sp.]HAW93141.1 flagellar cap protein [Candidatus Azambacteria bacterium]|tara:strand:- start:115 stop:1515 length:1401 start_codon:yes stop_codon:yes gene_type:complete